MPAASGVGRPGETHYGLEEFRRLALEEQVGGEGPRIVGLQIPNPTALGPLGLAAWAVAQAFLVARHGWTRASL